jgi:murein lipoprotein
MLIKKIALAALIITVTGCANTEALEASVSSLNQKVETLTNKVNALTNEVGEFKTQQVTNNETIDAVKSAVGSTNERMDNIVASYKK